MEKMYLTKEGILTKSVKEVYVSDNGEIFNTEKEAVLMDKLGKNISYPQRLEFSGFVWKYPNIKTSNMTISYKKENDMNDFHISFSIRKEGIFVNSLFWWNRCKERTDYINLDDMKNISINEIENIDFSEIWKKYYERTH